MNRRSLLLSAGAATLAGCASAANSPRDPRFGPSAPLLAADLDAAIARIMAMNVTPGLAVAVYTPDISYARAFGVTDIETGERADADTAFYIASSTKPLTSLALAKLHQRGELDLDTNLTEFAPDAPFPAAVRANEVTLRQLLSHTHGFENDPIGYHSAFSGQHDPQSLWRLLAQSEVNDEAPLGQFEYTNVGYNIATMLTDRRLGIRWQDLLDREVFAPLGMRRTSARMSTAQAGGWTVARPHEAPTGTQERISLEKTDQTMQSAGGVIISANDALRWLELMVRDGRVGAQQVVAPEVVAATRARLAETSGDMFEFTRSSYGLGWFGGMFRDDAIFSHFGGFAGFAAHVSYNPTRGVGVAAFSNGGMAGNLAIHTIADYVYSRAGYDDAETRLLSVIDDRQNFISRMNQRTEADRASRAQRPWTLTRPRAAYAGAYESDVWGRIEVSVDGETITAQYGVMHAVAEPFTQPDSIRVEFVPGQGEPIIFQGEGEHPPTLRTRHGTFQRV